MQGDLDGRGAAPADQTRRDHPGVVEHQEVARLEQVREVADPPVFERPIAGHQQPGGIARLGRALRDQRRRQVEGEQLGTHGRRQSAGCAASCEGGGGLPVSGRPRFRIGCVMPRVSAGLLPYRWRGDALEVFLVHPGGPLWASRDDGAWSIAKGEIGPDEAPLAAARREFEEETGMPLTGEVVGLRPIRQAGGKLVHAFAIEADLDPASVVSNRFAMEWPPRSGERREFPEVDRAGWFGLEVARRKLLAGQLPLLADLCERLRP